MTEQAGQREIEPALLAHYWGEPFISEGYPDMGYLKTAQPEDYEELTELQEIVAAAYLRGARELIGEDEPEPSKPDGYSSWDEVAQNDLDAYDCWANIVCRNGLRAEMRAALLEIEQGEKKE